MPLSLTFLCSWATVKHIVDTIEGLPDSNYVLLKDPNKNVVRLYQVQEQEEENELEDS